MAAAEAGDALELGPGTYAEAILIDKDLTLRGRDGAIATVLSGDRSFRPLEIRGATVVLEDLMVFRGVGEPGGGLSAEDATLTMRGCIVAECTSPDRAGAVFVRTTATTSAEFDDCVFRDCAAAGRGGALHASAGAGGQLVRLRFTRCRFLRNDGNAGGAVLLTAGASGARVDADFDRCTFEGNSGRDGGALLADAAIGDASIALDFRGCLFVDNEASGMGSALRLTARGVSSAVSARVLQCTLAANRAPDRPGGFTAISAEAAGDSTLQLQNSIVFGNSPPGVFTLGVDYEETASFVDVDPVFAGPERNDFRLGFGSPAVDAGDLALLTPDMLLDLDRKPRVRGVSVDCGAYERE